MLTGRLLGEPVFTLREQTASPLVTGRPAALLSYLAVTKTPQPRSLITDLLWDNVGEQQAKKNLRSTLRHLRNAVGDYVLTSGETIAFNQELASWIDVTVFTSSLSPAMISADAIPTDMAGATVVAEDSLLQEVLNLHRGEFMAGFQIDNASVFDSWIMSQRRRLHDLRVRGLQLSTQQQLAHGELQAALATNYDLLTLEPWREETHRQRMLLLAYSGQRNAALKQYMICCEVLAEELDVPPMEETTMLYEQIKAGEWLEFSKKAAALTARPIAVTSYQKTEQQKTEQQKAERQQVPLSPIQDSANQGQAMQQMKGTTRIDLGTMAEPIQFYGRAAELATIHSWVGQERLRLVALMGIGGQGKSALATAFVQDVLANETTLAHGFTAVIWRSLQETPTCTTLLHDWLNVLGDPQPTSVPSTFDHLITRLFAILEERRCLLVLDGWEAILMPPHEDDACVEEYQPGCEAYATLLRMLMERRHQSCLLLTSSVRPSPLSHDVERHYAIRSLLLEGITAEESTALLRARGISGDLSLFQKLHEQYTGNPKLLIKASHLIHELFAGDLAAFAAEGLLFLGELGATLRTQVSSLSPLEQQIAEILSEAEKPLDRRRLETQLSPTPAKPQYLCALQTLQRKFLLKQNGNDITLSPLFQTYLSERCLYSQLP